jgi:hypothetical protein
MMMMMMMMKKKRLKRVKTALPLGSARDGIEYDE